MDKIASHVKYIYVLRLDLWYIGITCLHHRD